MNENARVMRILDIELRTPYNAKTFIRSFPSIDPIRTDTFFEEMNQTATILLPFAEKMIFQSSDWVQVGSRRLIAEL